MKQFKAAQGSHLTDEQAEKYGKCIESLERQHGGVTAEIVLEEAKKRNSTLHDFFEWDNANAADAYRLSQASYLLRSIHVVILRDGDEEETRAFHPVLLRGEDMGKQYLSASVVFSDVDYHCQVIEQALRELTGWKRRYHQYKELSEIFEAIERVGRKVKA